MRTPPPLCVPSAETEAGFWDNWLKAGVGASVLREIFRGETRRLESASTTLHKVSRLLLIINEK